MHMEKHIHSPSPLETNSCLMSQTLLEQEWSWSLGITKSNIFNIISIIFQLMHSWAVGVPQYDLQPSFFHTSKSVDAKKQLYTNSYYFQVTKCIIFCSEILPLPLYLKPLYTIKKKIHQILKQGSTNIPNNH